MRSTTDWFYTLNPACLTSMDKDTSLQLLGWDFQRPQMQMAFFSPELIGSSYPLCQKVISPAKFDARHVLSPELLRRPRPCRLLAVDMFSVETALSHMFNPVKRISGTCPVCRMRLFVPDIDDAGVNHFGLGHMESDDSGGGGEGEDLDEDDDKETRPRIRRRREQMEGGDSDSNDDEEPPRRRRRLDHFVGQILRIADHLGVGSPSRINAPVLQSGGEGDGSGNARDVKFRLPKAIWCPSRVKKMWGR